MLQQSASGRKWHVSRAQEDDFKWNGDTKRRWIEDLIDMNGPEELRHGLSYSLPAVARQSLSGKAAKAAKLTRGM